MTEPQGMTFGDWLRPPNIVPTRDFIHQIMRDLDIEDREVAARVAQYVVDQIEEKGGASAQLYFDEEGSGPFCSWCDRIGGLCAHIAGRTRREREESSRG